jgi:putative ABC transport system ATP-binding protein
MSKGLLVLGGVERHYHVGDQVVRALDGIDLELDAGEIVMLLGPSGSGKTTLLNVVSALDVPTGGTYTFNGVEVPSAPEMSEKWSLANPATGLLGPIISPLIWLVNLLVSIPLALPRLLESRRRSKALEEMTTFRRENISYIFQFFNLLDDLTVLENVMLAQEIHGRRDREKAIRLLDLVGLAGLESRFPSEISGGQQQRVAIARSLAKTPKLLLGDEPSGNLDSATTDKVMRVLVDSCRAEGITAIIVTHDRSLTRFASRVLEIDSGKLVDDHAGGLGTTSGRMKHAAEGVAQTATEAITTVAEEITSAAHMVATKASQSSGAKVATSIGDSVSRIALTAAKAAAAVSREAVQRAGDVAGGVVDVAGAVIPRKKTADDSSGDSNDGEDS